MNNEEEPRPGNFDRAWNDPPLFSYSATASKPPEASATKLNKRIGFPASLSTKPAAQKIPDVDNVKLQDAGAKPANTNLPPPPPMIGGIPPPPMQSTGASGGAPSETNNVSSGTSENGILDVEEVIASLNSALTDLDSQIDKRKQQDISKRVAALEAKWRSDSLNPQVKAGMSKLAKCLDEKDYDGAEKIQVRLIVDWPSICGTWIVGIKHLIMQAKVAKAQECDKDSG